jgi:uncharacterized membrane protein YhaH (DUF805 family)
MNFAEAIASGFSKYIQFGDRASRSEYWYWTLFVVIATIVANIVDGMLGTTLISPVIGLALLLPGLAVSARRLHDIDRTFWWIVLAFTGIGGFVLLYWACLRGTTGPNRFGPDPL